jgi:hypothetical protein
VRHHHRVGTGVDAGDEGNEVERADLLQRTRIDGVVEVRVFQHRSVAGEMLERGGHLRGVHAFDVGTGELRDDLRIGGERTIADGAIAAAEVHDGREAQVHAAGAHFARHQPRVFLGEFDRAIGLASVELAELVERGQRAVPLAEALHAAAFLVHADQLRARRGFADGLRELGDLRARSEVAREQDDARARGMLQPVALLRGEFLAGDADHEHAGVPSGPAG